MSLLPLFLISALSRGARAEGQDGHHFKPVPTYGSPLDLVETWRIEAQHPRSFGLQGLFDTSTGSAVKVHQDWDGTTETALVEDVLALNLGLRASLHPRLALTLAGPLYLQSTGASGPQGAGIGDARIAAPIGLLLPGTRGLSLGLVPLIDLPTGDSAAFLGNTGLGGGGLVAAGWHAPRFTADLNLGYEQLPAVTDAQEQGGGRLLASLGAGFALTEHIGFSAEALLDAGLQGSTSDSAIDSVIDTGADPSGGEAAGHQSPAEGLLSLHGHHGRGLSWTAGGGAGLNDSAGAPAWRAFVGFGWAHIDDPSYDPDLDGIVGRADACPREAEVKNGWLDVEGCPDALADFTLTVTDEEGKVLAGLPVLIDGQPATTGADGSLTLTGRMPAATLTYTTSAPAYVVVEPQAARLEEGRNARSLVLAYLPGTTRVTAEDSAGKPIAATISLKGPTAMPALPLGAGGLGQVRLPAGQWQLLATAEGFGTEGRVLQVDGQKPGLTKVRFVLTPPKAVVEKKEVVISEAVLFDFNADTLRPDSDALLRQVAGQLLAHPEVTRVEIQGHSDDVGDDAYNLDLSQRRVDAVRSWLITNGVAEGRLVAKGYGEARPIAPNSTEAGRSKNRRVQFLILQSEAAPPAAEQGKGKGKGKSGG